MKRWIKRFSFKTISSPEDFDTLVQQVDKMAHRNPAFYRSRLRLLACLGYAYILAVFILLFTGLWGLRQYLTSIQNPELIESLDLVTALVTLGLLSLFFVHFERPKGIALTRSQVPQLFTLLDELTSVMKAPRLDNVVLNEELNAAIVQRPRYGFIGWQRNYLLIGLPLLQALSPQQCKAVLAHELAHLCGDDGRTSAWIYRIRRTWYELAERFEHNHRGGFLFQRFFSWYGPFFRAYSFVHARSQEYEADRRAASIVGPQHKAEALIWLNLNAHLLQKQYWSDYYRRVLHRTTPDDDAMSQVLQIIKTGISPDHRRSWLSLCLAQQTSNSSTHPCLSDRLDALDYEIPRELNPPDRRATALLGDQLADLTEQLNQFWKQEETKDWSDDHDCGQLMAARLDRLTHKPEHLLTVEEKIKRAALTWQLQDRPEALSMFQRLVIDAPKLAVAHYWLGYLLTEDGQEEGVQHLQFAMDQDLALVIPACRQCFVYYHHQNLPDKAEAYRQRWQQHQKTWKMARTERLSFKPDTRFKPHGLPEAEIRQLVEYFSNFSEIKSVYLAQKVVDRCPESPYFVFGITRRNRQNMDQEYQSDQKLNRLIEAGIAFSPDYSLYCLHELTSWERLKRLEGAKIYP